MPKPFHQISVTEFQALVGSFKWKRSITAVHMHHTWQPNHSQYKGLSTIEAMWNHHVNVNHWSDIAQHLSIAPDGTLWTGRGWNTPPASSSGHNGSAQSGPFMFETIGNFDTGRDAFEGEQKAAVIGVIGTLLDHFELPISALRFHRQLGSPKSCPGTSIPYEAFCAEVEAWRTANRSLKPRSMKTGSRAMKKANSALMKSLASVPRSWERDVASGCCAEHVSAGADALSGIGITPHATESASRSAPAWTEAEREILFRHAINLRNGQFIESGDFTTTAKDVQRLFEVHLKAALDEAKENNRPLRVLFWAHGGLCGERDMLQNVLTYHRGWLNAGVYPVYFIWETDHATSLHDIFLGAPAARGWMTDITDAGLEFTLQTVGRPIWRQIKEYAANSVKKPTGGALFAAQQLAKFVKTAKSQVELYAMGHSAGSIFHSWFIPAALGAGVPSFKELFLLAPAINVAEFKERLGRHIGPQRGIHHCSMFTMTERAERDDTVISIYRKSLLYFVSRACEEADETPILGLQESVYRDAELRKLFGVDPSGTAAAGDIQWSPNGSTSNSTTHGGFDNDYATLHCMVKRITGVASTPFANIAARQLATPAPNRKSALCVGIDRYSRKPLSGCVNDARQWQSTLQTLGFETTLLTDEQATYDGMVNALRCLIRGSRPGDQLVFQYAGHGTQVDDVDGDEALNGSPDREDEALVPVDFDTGRFLIDDDLGEIMNDVPPGVSLTCFMDCCHSGTNTRKFGFGDTSSAAAGEVSRYLPVPAAIMIRHVAYRSGQPSKPVRRSYQGKPEVLFAACAPVQEAKEMGGHGYFTITAAPLLAQAAGKLTHAQFMAAVQAAFPGTVQDQDPQLDCSDDRRGDVLFAAPAGRVAPTPGPLPAPEVVAKPCVTSGSLDVQQLNHSINTFLKILERHV